jgi:hypothetical protein
MLTFPPTGGGNLLHLAIQHKGNVANQRRVQQRMQGVAVIMRALRVTAHSGQIGHGQLAHGNAPWLTSK